MTVRVLRGDCRDVLRTLPDCSVQCCVTSPPYYGLRDYGVAGQLGLEASPDEYVAQLVGVFREVRRVLRDDGVCWLNLGDSYNNRTKVRTSSHQPALNNFVDDNWAERAARGGCRMSFTEGGLKEKDLLMIPARVALALQADGWWLRSDVIWAKPNPMPESCRDRPTSSHEHVFLLTKRASYFYDADAIAEDSVSDHPSGNGFKRDARLSFADAAGPRGNDKQWNEVGGKRNARNWWVINSQPYSGAHFATMPPDLAERCIKAGTSEVGCCPACGAPWGRIMSRGESDLAHQRACGGDANGEYFGRSTKNHAAAGVQDASAVKARILAGMVVKETAGWALSCNCPLQTPVPCMVLDPFGGSGTTGLVADRLGRNALLIELSDAYNPMIRDRLIADGPLFMQLGDT